MKKITNKIKKKFTRVGCKHNFEKLAIYHISRKEVHRCSICGKRIEKEF